MSLTSPDQSILVPALTALGGSVTSEGSELIIVGVTAEQIGDAARDVQARIHQLVTNEATLEEAFLDATGLSEEFKGGGAL